VAAVVTNAALVCFTMDVLRHQTGYARLWIFIGFQWVLIAVQFVAQAVVPDVPEEVEVQGQRMDFINEKVIEKVFDEDAELVSTASVDGDSGKNGGDKEHVDNGCCDCFSAHHEGKGLEKKLRFAHVADFQIRQYPVNGQANTSNPMQK
jgi:hypothetical protein